MKNERKTHKPYVKRRLDKIRNVIKEFDCLKLVPSGMNPADIATRGLFPLLLSKSDLWLFGPEILYSPSSQWPNLQAGDNFTFPSTPNHNLINDSVSAMLVSVYCVLILIILLKQVQVYSKLTTM